jgi:hypothetical protein
MLTKNWPRNCRAIPVFLAPIGACAICTDAINEDATAFYTKHQFQPLVSRPQTLFLPMKTALDLVGT